MEVFIEYILDNVWLEAFIEYILDTTSDMDKSFYHNQKLPNH